jgi:hypothetical protein
MNENTKITVVQINGTGQLVDVQLAADAEYQAQEIFQK